MLYEWNGQTIHQDNKMWTQQNIVQATIRASARQTLPIHIQVD